MRHAERMVQLGQRIDWIPNERHGPPTSDYIWHDQGLLATELKSPEARYETIRRGIERAVIKSSAQGVPKANFMVDLEGAPLTDQLRRQLGTYNVTKSRRNIQRLFVMHSGRIEEIPLQT